MEYEDNGFGLDKDKAEGHQSYIFAFTMLRQGESSLWMNEISARETGSHGVRCLA